GNGRSIYVPSDQVHTVRATLARDGLLPRSGEPGYEIFDNEKLGVSPLVQKMNQNRAIQGELARTIQIYDGVESARVHVVRPEQTMFSTDGVSAKAGVMLRLRPGYRLPGTTVAAISNLVAGAIEGLAPENVTITDSNGRMLTSTNGGDETITGANSYKDYKTAVEQDMTQRLLRSMETVLGPGRASVIAHADLDMTSETIVKTTFEKGIPIEEIIQESKITQDAIVDGEGKPKTAGTQETTGTTTSEYKVPETRTTTTTVPGKISSWSIAVMVDLEMEKELAATGEEGSEDAPAATEVVMIMTVEDVKDIVRTAIGAELLKEENLTVKHVRFNRPQTAMLTEEPSSYEKLAPVIEIARQSSMGILAICALLVLKIFTGAGKKAAADTADIAGQQALAAGINQQALVAADPNSLRDQIAMQIRENPEQVRQLFSTWLSEGK
ncbi:MAG: flagellar basal-body MS-ring/collar protein FliF, partial [Planctomycetota bacterium]